MNRRGPMIFLLVFLVAFLIFSRMFEDAGPREMVPRPPIAEDPTSIQLESVHLPPTRLPDFHTKIIGPPAVFAD